MATGVSVVVPCRNEAGHIATLLGAIAAQELPVDEVIVVDGASTDSTRAEVEDFRRANPGLDLTLVEGPACGIPTALNIGITRARGEVIVRLDAHSFPRRDYVRRAVDRLCLDQVGVVGGRWVVQPGAATAVARAIALAVRHPLVAGDAAYRLACSGDALRDVESVPFGCYRKDLWKQLGGYNEALQVAEDYEFNHRARNLGVRVVLDPAMCSTYVARATWRSLARQYFRYGWWKGEVFRRFPDAWRPRTLVPAAFVLTLAALAVGALLVDVAVVTLWAVLGCYGAALVAGSLHAAGAGCVRLAPLVALAFAFVHLTQGTGLLLNLAARRATRRFA